MSLPPSGNKRALETRSSLLWLAASLLFWIVAAFCRLPGPHPCDDLVFVPPALELVHGQVMSNPQIADLLQSWGMHSDRWFSHFPIYQLVLTGWLRAFGISALSMLAFQCVVNCLVQVGLFAGCRLRKIHPAWSLIAGLAYFTSVMASGMRPEPLAFLFLLSGFLFLGRKERWALFGAGALFCAAGATLPQATIYAALFGIALAANIVLSSEFSARERGLRLGILLLSAIPALSAFHFGIGGDWRMFLADYHQHLTVGTVSGSSRWEVFMLNVKTFAFGFEPLRAATILAGLALSFWLAIRAENRLTRLLLAGLVAAGFLTLFTALPGAYRTGLLLAVTTCGAIAAAAELFEKAWGQAILGFSLALVPGVTCLTTFVEALANPPDRVEEARRIIAANPGVPIYANGDAVWDVFDWRLPPFFKSLHLNRDFGRLSLPDNAIIVDQLGNFETGNVRLFGREFHSLKTKMRTYIVVDVHGHELSH